MICFKTSKNQLSDVLPDLVSEIRQLRFIRWVKRELRLWINQDAILELAPAKDHSGRHMGILHKY